MAYETPITVYKAIEHIKKRHYVLPSIQREFVWEPEQIEMLFDSLMRDYPIGTFLFWKIEKSKIENFQFYEFLKKYHEKNSKHNIKIDLSNDDDVIAILDGQQRMTSLYIALSGSYSVKIPYKRVEDEDAYPEKFLHLDLLNRSEDLECEYSFRFITKEEAQQDDTTFWFCVPEILKFDKAGDIMSYLMDSGLTDSSKYPKDQGRFAMDTLNNLFNTIHQKGIISYYLEEGEELDKVLQIFIRINSGGTKLSYSDLLLSIATAQWKDKDAREIIHEFVDDINLIGDGFKFNKDFVLKACLVLGDLADIKFKIDNFTKDNMKLIESNWEKASKSIRIAIKLAAKFGYNRHNLIANNAIIPIAYFIQVNNFGSSILHKGDRAQDRKSIREWLARVFLKGTFGGTPDAIYPVMRNIINKNQGKFPLEEIIQHYHGKRRSIIFSIEDIDSILQLQYGKAKTFNALSLLYPSLNFSYKYHQDHIHPKSFFKRRGEKMRQIEDRERRLAFRENFNSLPNLQLLEANENEEKSNKLFNDWVNEKFQDETSKKAYLLQHHINVDTSLAFDDFLDFYSQRSQAIKEKLISILRVNLTTQEEIA